MWEGEAMARRNYLKCILGLDRADCFRADCRYFDRGGCQYKAPEPVKPLGLQRRSRPSAAARPMPEPGEAA